MNTKNTPVYNSDLFDFAIKNGMINKSELMSQYIEMQNAKILEKHFGLNWETQIKKRKDGRYYTRLPDGRQLRKTDRYEFIESIIEYYQEKTHKIYKTGFDITSIFNEWMEYKKTYEIISQGTIDRYIADFDRFFIRNPRAEMILNMPIEKIDEDTLEKFIKITIKEMNLTPKAWSKLKALIKGIWIYAKKIKATDIAIISFMEELMIKPKSLHHEIKTDEEQVFTDEEAVKIIEYINNKGYSPHGYGIILAFYTGLRIGEISGLMWKDISDNLKTIYVNHMERLCNNDEGVKNNYSVIDHVKTEAGIREVILPDECISYIKELKKHTGNEEFVFINTETGKRLHARSFTDKLYNICKQLGIKKRSMHKIRKTVCSKMCDAGIDKRFLLKQIGHTDERTTEQFYHRDRRSNKEKRDILNKVLTY